jgi:hypothetical protein
MNKTFLMILAAGVFLSFTTITAQVKTTAVDYNNLDKANIPGVTIVKTDNATVSAATDAVGYKLTLKELQPLIKNGKITHAAIERYLARKNGFAAPTASTCSGTRQHSLLYGKILTKITGLPDSCSCSGYDNDHLSIDCSAPCLSYTIYCASK